MNLLRGSRSRQLAIAAINLCLVVAAVSLAYRRLHDTSLPADGTQGSWTTATSTTTQNELSIQGVLLPVRSVDIVAPMEGRLVSLDVAWGDRVAEGQLLASVASPELTAQLREAEASLLRSRLDSDAQIDPKQSAEFRAAQRRERVAAGELALARSREADTRSLFDKDFVARMELDQAQRDVDTAQRQVEEAQEEVAVVKRKWEPDQLRARRLEMANREAKLQELKDRQLASSLRAPISGVVMYPVRPDNREGQSVEFKPGSQVSSRDAIMTIGDTSSFVIRGSVSEFDVRWLKPGLPATVQLATLPGSRIAAQVIRVAAQGRSSGGLAGSAPEFEIQVQIPAPGSSLTPEDTAALRVGSTAKVDLKEKGTDAMLVLPMAAVRWADDGAAQVRVQGRDDSVEWRRISIAKATTDQVFVRQGLQAADRVWVPADDGSEPDSSPGFLRKLLGAEEDR